ncbi:MAG TPA: DUF1501 domain-containing protein [Tepidisphaeraceae bacterium]|jgi:hypothetical protein|nr:DUF1501 domain-containing protein [Tepidisphaeraceae bacterium]
MTQIDRTSRLPFLPLTRRQALMSAGAGFGYLAFRGLAAQAAALESGTAPKFDNPLAAKKPPFPAKAKRVIFLFMQGGPSHVDTFDYKPKLQQAAGQAGEKGRLLPSSFNFQRYGHNGLYVSDLYPNVARHADELCMINSMHTDNPAHPQATIQLHTGSAQFVRPSVGAWVLYGLGTTNQNLPGYITINPPAGLGGAQNYGSAFLPATYQGTRLEGNGAMSDINPIMPAKLQRRQLDLLQAMNRDAENASGSPDQIEGVIQSYELGFRMQSAVPELLDISKETAATKALYGIGDGKSDTFGRQCLMARRFAQAGVRFIEVCYTGWDTHNNLHQRMTANAAGTDKPIAGLLADLKSHGLLNDTLVIWGGEFGRTPTSQGADGRNHNNRGYSMWMAGGGAKPCIHGKTDDFGAAAVESPVHVHDLHATTLALLGLDPENLTYKYAGRDFRLIDVKGHVVKEIIA